MMNDTMGRWFTGLGHGALWLGVSFIAPVRSHANESTRGQIPTSAITATRQSTDRNWHTF